MAAASGHQRVTEELGGIKLFRNLSDAALADIARQAQLRTYGRGEHIVIEGDRCEAAYFVVSGEVRVYRVSSEGREQVLVRVKPGQAFNTVPPFQENGRNRANAVAIVKSTLLVLRSREFLDLTLKHSDLSLAIFRDFAQRLTHLTDLVENLALHSVQKRLVRFLLAQADQSAAEKSSSRDSSTGEMPLEVKRWTQQDIAVHLGTVRDVIGRSLRALEDDNLIRVNRGRIVLLNRDKLEDLARRG